MLNQSALKLLTKCCSKAKAMRSTFVQMLNGSHCEVDINVNVGWEVEERFRRLVPVSCARYVRCAVERGRFLRVTHPSAAYVLRRTFARR
ncbi:MAG: hypothetical protein ACTS6A_00945 [Candidatus Hodgkinia cicadicola]